MGSYPYLCGNIKSPDTGHEIEILQYIRTSHRTSRGEEQGFLPEETGTMKDITMAIDEQLHQIRDLESIHRRGKNDPVSLFHLLLEERGFVLERAILLTSFKTLIASAAILEMCLFKHHIFPFDRDLLLDDLADPFGGTIRIPLPRTSHDDENLHGHHLVVPGKKPLKKMQAPKGTDRHQPSVLMPVERAT